MKLIHHHSSCVIQWEHHAGKQQSNLTTKQMTKISNKTNKRNNVEMVMSDISFDKANFEVISVSSGQLKQPEFIELILEKQNVFAFIS